MYIYKLEYCPASFVDVDWSDAHGLPRCRLRPGVQDWRVLPTIGLVAMDIAHKHERGLHLCETRISGTLCHTAAPPPPFCAFRLTDTAGRRYYLGEYRGVLPLFTLGYTFPSKASEASKATFSISYPFSPFLVV